MQMQPIRMACSGYIHVRENPPLQAWLNSSNSLFEGGGMPISTNRSLWPVTGGSVGIQPGWFNGHSSAFFYINLGDGTTPENYSSPMLPVFQIKGPNNFLYNGSICLTQIPLPKGYKAVIGHNATIQVIETAQHGAALYNVRNRSPMIYVIITDCETLSVQTSPLPIQRMYLK